MAPLLTPLSYAEEQVYDLCVKGLNNKEIACVLCRSKRTVQFHLHAIFRKAQVRDRAQLIVKHHLPHSEYQEVARLINQAYGRKAA